MDAAEELAAIILPGNTPWLIRCGMPERIAGGAIIGACPAGVMARIATAVRRELEARRVEQVSAVL